MRGLILLIILALGGWYLLSADARAFLDRVRINWTRWENQSRYRSGQPLPGTPDLAKLDERLAAFGGSPYGVITPGGARAFKYWPAGHYADAIRALGKAGPRCWVIDGAPREAGICSEVAAGLSRVDGVQVLNLCSSGMLRLAATIERASLVISTDNGALHVATALGRPAVGIVGGWNKYRYFPWGDPAIHRTPMFEMPCWGCSRRLCDRARCLDPITPKVVAAEAAGALAEYDRQREKQS